MNQPDPTAPPPLGPAAAAARVLEAMDRGEGVVVALLLEGAHRGWRRVVTAEAAHGELGDLEAEAQVDALSRQFLLDDLEVGRTGADAGSLETPSGLRVYLERTLPPPPLLIVGAGHLAGPLCQVGALLGYRVTVADDRPSFARVDRFPQAERVIRVDFSDPFREVELSPRHSVLLVTRGHRYDYECLRRLLELPTPPAYLGMIGSRRRVRATFHQLLEEGVPRERLSLIRAPVGLDVGAETPEEIAVAVGAELIMARRGGTGTPLAQVERVAERFFPRKDGSHGE